MWAGLILAPLLALADQSVSYALVEWSCAHQNVVAGHVVHALFFVATVATFFPALPRRHEVLGMVSIMVSVLSALVILAMWLPQWFLSPCIG